MKFNRFGRVRLWNDFSLNVMYGIFLNLVLSWGVIFLELYFTVSFFGNSVKRGCWGG